MHGCSAFRLKKKQSFGWGQIYGFLLPYPTAPKRKDGKDNGNVFCINVKWNGMDMEHTTHPRLTKGLTFASAQYYSTKSTLLYYIYSLQIKVFFYIIVKSHAFIFLYCRNPFSSRMAPNSASGLGFSEASSLSSLFRSPLEGAPLLLLSYLKLREGKRKKKESKSNPTYKETIHHVPLFCSEQSI